MVSWAPGLVFTIASISTGLLALLLPETLNRPLPDTIEEIESWSRTLPKDDCVDHEAQFQTTGDEENVEDEEVKFIREKGSTRSDNETAL